MELVEKIQPSNTNNSFTVTALSILSLFVIGYSASHSIASDLITSLDEFEPSINIESYDNRTTEEYSHNNNVYMIKVTPTMGAPYYLVDPDGSGDMEWKRDTGTQNIAPPKWTLRSW